MNIKLVFCGALAAFAGIERADLEIPGGSTYARLLDEIGRELGPNMRSGLWDAERKSFKTGVLAVRDIKELKQIQDDTVLNDGDEIRFFFRMAGG